MYIIVNGYPIDVYKIDRVSEIIKLNKDFYEKVLKGLVGYIGRKEATLSDLYEEYKKVKIEDYRFYHTTLNYLDRVHQAVFGEGISIVDKTYNQYYNQYYNNNNNSNKPRLRRGDEINWGALPDIYFFSLMYEKEIFYSGCKTTPKQIFSEFYEIERDAEEARDELLKAINTVRCQVPRVDI